MNRDLDIYIDGDESKDHVRAHGGDSYRVVVFQDQVETNRESIAARGGDGRGQRC